MHRDVKLAIALLGTSSHLSSSTKTPFGVTELSSIIRWKLSLATHQKWKCSKYLSFTSDDQIFLLKKLRTFKALSNHLYIYLNTFLLRKHLKSPSPLSFPQVKALKENPQLLSVHLESFNLQVHRLQ